jgi:small subunit ribosomal protein S20
LANTRSAIKRIKQSEKRRLRNRAVRSKLRSAVKGARTSLQGGATDARTTVQSAMRTLDRAVTRGVIHRNTAARKKSALARKLAKMA